MKTTRGLVTYVGVMNLLFDNVMGQGRKYVRDISLLIIVEVKIWVHSAINDDMKK